MKKCELCNSKARVYCESDQASLCWDCDARVHTANFLVAKHSRILLCNTCQSLTPWTGSGSKLGPTVSVCQTCFHRNNNNGADQDHNLDDHNDREEEDDEDKDDDDDDDDDDGGSSDGDNQVVPLSSSTTDQPCPPSLTSSSSSSEDSNSRFYRRRIIGVSNSSSRFCT
ncbi:unnamed protein product [Withania somnifera]